MSASDPYRTPAAVEAHSEKSRPFAETYSGAVSLVLTLLSVSAATGVAALFRSTASGLLVFIAIDLFAVSYAGRAIAGGGVLNPLLGTLTLLMQIFGLLLFFIS